MGTRHWSNHSGGDSHLQLVAASATARPLKFIHTTNGLLKACARRTQRRRRCGAWEAADERVERAGSRGFASASPSLVACSRVRFRLDLLLALDCVSL